VVRSFLDGRLEVGSGGLIARGYTGQTTETFDPNWSVGTSATNLPFCAPGSGPSGLPNGFNCGTVERAVGIRMVSWPLLHAQTGRRSSRRDVNIPTEWYGKHYCSLNRKVNYKVLFSRAGRFNFRYSA
jgi:hypothetical protein